MISFLPALPGAFIEGIGGPEMLMVLFIVLLLFGGEKLPGFARGLGKSIREFKKAASSVEEEFKRALEEEPEKPAPQKWEPPALPPASPALAVTDSLPSAESHQWDHPPAPPLPLPPPPPSPSPAPEKLP